MSKENNPGQIFVTRWPGVFMSSGCGGCPFILSLPKGTSCHSYFEETSFACLYTPARGGQVGTACLVILFLTRVVPLCGTKKQIIYLAETSSAYNLAKERREDELKFISFRLKRQFASDILASQEAQNFVLCSFPPSAGEAQSRFHREPL